LFDNPTRPLHLASLMDSSGVLRAYGIWHLEEFDARIRMAVLRDVFCIKEDTEALRRILQLLFAHWRKKGITWVSLEFASPWITALFREIGFEHVPSHGNRYYVSSQFPIAAPILCNWFRSGIDGDYFDLPVS
jgi:hypothetical protein